MKKNQKDKAEVPWSSSQEGGDSKWPVKGARVLECAWELFQLRVDVGVLS